MEECNDGIMDSWKIGCRVNETIIILYNSR
jgi:hypothetical protein